MLYIEQYSVVAHTEIRMEQVMSIVREYPELMYPEIIIPMISMSTCIIMGILDILYNKGILLYPPETVIIFTLLFCIIAKVAWSWRRILAAI